MRPFLSKNHAPPPRFTTSICQRVLLAGIATANVSAVAAITPQRIPNKKIRLILSLGPFDLVGFPLKSFSVNWVPKFPKIWGRARYASG
jgi:hypothetical protein